MIDISKAATFPLGDRIVKRLGYGAMQLAGPRVLGRRRTRWRDRGAPRGDGERRRSHRHERHLRPARHRSTHPRSAPSLSRRSRHRHKMAPGAARTHREPGDVGRGADSAVHDNLRNLGWTRSMSSICASCSTPPGLPRVRSRAARRARGASAPGARPSHRPQQCDAQADRRRPRHRRRSSACRTTIMSRAATTTR